MKIISRVLESEAWVRQMYLFGFGIYLLLFPSLGLQMLLLTVVGLLTVLGSYNLFRFFLNKNKTKGYSSYMILGALQVVLAIFLYLNLNSAKQISIILFALFSLFNAGLNLKRYLEFREQKSTSSILSLVLVGLNVALALVLIFSPFSYLVSKSVLVGIALIVINGIDLYEEYIHHQKKQDN